METNVNVNNLTAEELQVIENLRKEAAAKIELTKAHEQKKYEEAVASVKERIATAIKANQEIVTATKEYFKSFNCNKYNKPIWKLVEKIEKRTFNKMGEYNRETKESPLLYEESFDVVDVVIRTNDNRFTVKVDRHVVHTGNYIMHSDYKGMKMYISSTKADFSYADEQRAYAHASTIEKKVNAIYEAEKAAVIFEKNKQTAQEKTIAKLREYGEVKVSKETYRKGHRFEVYTYDQAQLTLPNDVIITYRLSTDGSLSRERVTFNQKDEYLTLSKLAALKF